ncbi:hypothetical protein IWQ61_005312 [Dispira simplex]|nr:hypothetical protein IWQ61_005312 [Dispira simplex]
MSQLPHSVELGVLVEILQRVIAQERALVGSETTEFNVSPLKTQLFQTYNQVLRHYNVDPNNDVIYYEYVRHISSLPGSNWTEKLSEFLRTRRLLVTPHRLQLPLVISTDPSPPPRFPTLTPFRPAAQALLRPVAPPDLTLTLKQVRSILHTRQQARQQGLAEIAGSSLADWSIDLRLYLTAWRKFAKHCKKRREVHRANWGLALQFRRQGLLRTSFRRWWTRLDMSRSPGATSEASQVAEPNITITRLGESMWEVRTKRQVLSRWVTLYNDHLDQDQNAQWYRLAQVWQRWRTQLLEQYSGALYRKNIDRAATLYQCSVWLYRMYNTAIIRNHLRVCQQAQDYRMVRSTWNQWRTQWHTHQKLARQAILFERTKRRHEQGHVLRMLRLHCRLAVAERQHTHRQKIIALQNWRANHRRQLYLLENATHMAQSYQDRLTRKGITKWATVVQQHRSLQNQADQRYHLHYLASAFHLWRSRNAHQLVLRNQANRMIQMKLWNQFLTHWRGIHQRRHYHHLLTDWETQRNSYHLRQAWSSWMHKYHHREELYRRVRIHKRMAHRTLQIRHFYQWQRKYQRLGRLQTKADNLARTRLAYKSIELVQQRLGSRIHQRQKCRNVLAVQDIESITVALQAWRTYIANLDLLEVHCEQRRHQRLAHTTWQKWRSRCKYGQLEHLTKRWEMQHAHQVMYQCYVHWKATYEGQVHCAVATKLIRRGIVRQVFGQWQRTLYSNYSITAWRQTYSTPPSDRFLAVASLVRWREITQTLDQAQRVAQIHHYASLVRRLFEFWKAQYIQHQLVGPVAVVATAHIEHLRLWSYWQFWRRCFKLRRRQLQKAARVYRQQAIVKAILQWSNRLDEQEQRRKQLLVRADRYHLNTKWQQWRNRLNEVGQPRGEQRIDVAVQHKLERITLRHYFHYWQSVPQRYHQPCQIVFAVEKARLLRHYFDRWCLKQADRLEFTMDAESRAYCYQQQRWFARWLTVLRAHQLGGTQLKQFNMTMQRRIEEVVPREIIGKCASFPTYEALAQYYLLCKVWEAWCQRARMGAQQLAQCDNFLRMQSFKRARWVLFKWRYRAVVQHYTTQGHRQERRMTHLRTLLVLWNTRATQRRQQHCFAVWKHQYIGALGKHSTYARLDHVAEVCNNQRILRRTLGIWSGHRHRRNHQRKLQELRTRLRRYQLDHTVAHSWLQWLKRLAREPVMRDYYIRGEMQHLRRQLTYTAKYSNPSIEESYAGDSIYPTYFHDRFEQRVTGIAIEYYHQGLIRRLYIQWKVEYFRILAHHERQARFALTWFQMGHLRLTFRHWRSKARQIAAE